MVKLKFLIVDDSVSMRKIVAKLLKDAGHEDVVEAEDGGEAYQKLLEDISINFVILDWNMPTCNGLQFTKKVRSSNDPGIDRDIPIIMVCLRNMKDEIVEALHAKVNHYIVKPMTSAELHGKIKEVMRKLDNP